MASLKLNKKAFALALGIIAAIYLFVLALLPVLFNDLGKTMILEIQSVYPGYTWGILGAIIGAVYGFIDGFIFGFLMAFFYNKFAK